MMSFQPGLTVVAANPVRIQVVVLVIPEVAIEVGVGISDSPPHVFALRALRIVDIEFNR
ncbi:hypothetical protein D3C74_393100 [compost metagenome]